MTDAHPYTHSTGKLKLKGVKDSKIDKKHSKSKKTKTKTKTKTEVDGGEAQHDNSVMLKKLEDEDWAMARENTKVQEGGGDTKGEEDADADAPADAEDDELLPERRKTEAEKRYDEQRRKRLDERLRREGIKTHKQRVEELNRYLSGLSEHHDMPRIGPG